MTTVNTGIQHPDPIDMAEIREAIKSLRLLVMPWGVDLSEEVRQQYFRVQEINRQMVDKVKHYAEADPSIASPDVKWLAFQLNCSSLEFLTDVEIALSEMLLAVTNRKIVHEWERFHAALIDYSYTQYRQAAGAEGFDQKYNDLRQLFKKDAAAAAPVAEA